MKKKSSKLSSKRLTKRKSVKKISKHSQEKLILDKIKKLKSVAVVYADFKNPRKNPANHEEYPLSDSFAAWRDANQPDTEYISRLQRMSDDDFDQHFARKNPSRQGLEHYTKVGIFPLENIQCNFCGKKGSTISDINHDSGCPNYSKNKIKRLENYKGYLDSYNFVNPSSKFTRRNPGGGWIFESTKYSPKFLSKFDAIRGRNVSDDILNKNGDFYVQIRDRKDGGWYIALVNRRSLGDNIINIKNIVSEVFEDLTFTGIGAREWEDLRIGYKSKGFELLNKRDNLWYSVLASVHNNKVTVMDVKMKLSGPMFSDEF